MESTQQYQREELDSRQKAHEKTQLDLLEKYENELVRLNIYLANELNSLNNNDLLFNRMKICKIIIDNFLIIIDKCMNSYHFGCEVFLYFVETFMGNEGRAIKDESRDYSVSLSDLKKFVLFTKLQKVLISIPFEDYIIKRVRSELNQLLPSSDYDKIFESAKNYLDIGYSLKDELIIKNIKSELSKLRAIPTVASYYAAIIGPSFMGKTQTAFTLSHCMTVLYMNLIIGSNTDSEELGDNQKIYQAFYSFSKILNSIIDDDIKDIQDVEGNINASDFDKDAQQKIPFKILGLIFVIIKMKLIRSEISNLEWFKSIIDIERAWIPAMTIETFTINTKSKINSVLL